MNMVPNFIRVEDLPAPLIRHLNGLWRRRWTVVIAAWAAALMGWFAVWLLPDLYESRAQVFVQTETVLQPVLGDVVATPDYADRVDVMRLQLLARPNVEEIIYRAGLDRLIETSNEVEHRAAMQGLVDGVAGNIMIESPRDMYFVISYAHGDPDIAKRVTDAVLNLLIEQDIGASLSESGAARRRLELQIEDFEKRLSANELRVAEFRSEHAVELAATEGVDRRAAQKEDDLARTAEEISDTRGRILTLENLLSATPRGASGGELERLRVELAALRSKYQDSHPDIRGVTARINELERNNGALATNPEFIRLQSELSVARNAVAVLEAREQTQRQELQALVIAASQAPAVIAELKQIERQYETTKDTYEELLHRRDRLQLTQNLGPAGRGVEYQIFERPERAIKPSEPARQFLIYLVVFAAIGAGVAFGVLINLIDRTYTQSEELEKAFGLPVLGAFTETPSVEVRTTRRRDALRLAGAGAALFAMGFVYTYLSVGRLPATLEEEAAAFRPTQTASNEVAR